MNTNYNIIKLIPDNKIYYPNYMERDDWMDENQVKRDEIEIPIGKSRYGGCVIDLPPDVKMPENMRFAGQLDLSEVSKMIEKIYYLNLVSFCFLQILYRTTEE